MPKTRDKRRKTAASMEDRISALPDDVLQLVVSSLPSDEAVRTCVLAQRWRHLWRSARALRITHRRKDNWTLRSLTNFVNHLLRLRNAGSPMDELEISCGELDADTCYNSDTCECECEDLSRSTGMWIHHALSICSAKVLNVSFYHDRRLCLDDVPFVSHLLTKATLSHATFVSHDLDFSMCPALEDLKMTKCRIHVSRISSSQSLTLLSITDCKFHSIDRTRISAPSVVSLELSVASGRAPFVENMPSLEAAHVRIWCDSCTDMCNNNASHRDRDCQVCDGCRGSSDGRSVLLQGLSGAADLELTSDPNVFIFRKDCQFSTTFTNLKALVLNEWCMVPNFAALAYFLRYSPILEKLTLQLEYCQNKHTAFKIKTKKGPREKCLVSRKLKVVRIKCHKNNKLVVKVSKLLTAYGISEEQISIEPNFCPPESCYDESTDSEDYY